MENAALYRQYAANCLNIVRQISDATAKSSLLDMAMVWVSLAHQSEKITAAQHVAAPRQQQQPEHPLLKQKLDPQPEKE